MCLFFRLLPLFFLLAIVHGMYYVGGAILFLKSLTPQCVCSSAKGKGRERGDNETESANKAKVSAYMCGTEGGGSEETEGKYGIHQLVME